MGVTASQVSAPVQHDDFTGTNSKIRLPREANVRKGRFIRYLVGNDAFCAFLPANRRGAGVRPKPTCPAAGGAQFCSGVVEKWRAGQDETGHSYVIVFSFDTSGGDSWANRDASACGSA
jgi:hypothetical protein